MLCGRRNRCKSPYFLSQYFPPPYFKYSIKFFPHAGPSISPYSQHFLFSILPTLSPISPSSLFCSSPLSKSNYLRMFSTYIPSCIRAVLSSLDTVFSGPYIKHFQSAFKQSSLNRVDTKITAVIGNGLKFAYCIS